MRPSFLTEIINNSDILSRYPNLKKYLDKEKINELVQNIQTQYLYPSKFHGLYHSEKVAFFSFIIGKYYNLDPEDMEIILDAAVYHDIGRTSDFEDTTHGLTSSLKIGFLKDKQIYTNEINFKLLKAIIDGHCLDDKSKKIIFENYDLPQTEYERFNLLYSILKDADALDRLRFDKTMKAILNDCYLRLPISKRLIPVADYLNKEYRHLIDMKNYDNIQNLLINQEPHLFYHGIGFNFFAIPSILKNGITSLYSDKSNPKHIRNFAGHNNNMWISAIDAENLKEGYQEFIKDGLYFEFTSSLYHHGLENKITSLDSGMPYRSNLYQDEVFIFESIAPEEIISLSLSKEMFDKPFRTINLIKGTNSYEKVKERVNYYCQFLNPKKVKKYQQLFEAYFQKLCENTVHFEHLNNYEQQQSYQEFLSSQDDLVMTINNLLVLLYINDFKDVSPKKDLTVGDFLLYILNSHQISYTINDENHQVKITFPTIQLKR